MSYVRDRLEDNNKIPRLTELMRLKAKTISANTPVF